MNKITKYLFLLFFSGFVFSFNKEDEEDWIYLNNQITKALDEFNESINENKENINIIIINQLSLINVKNYDSEIYKNIINIIDRNKNYIANCSDDDMLLINYKIKKICDNCLNNVKRSIKNYLKKIRKSKIADKKSKIKKLNKEHPAIRRIKEEYLN